MKAALAVFCLFLCTACSASSTPGPTHISGITSTKEMLINRQFQLDTANGKHFPTAPGRPKPVLNFMPDMIVSGRICNSFNGKAQWSNNVMFVPETASTLMICSEPGLNELEAAFFDMLHTGTVVNLDERTGILTLSSDELTLKYKPID